MLLMFGDSKKPVESKSMCKEQEFKLNVYLYFKTNLDSWWKLLKRARARVCVRTCCSVRGWPDPYHQQSCCPPHSLTRWCLSVSFTRSLFSPLADQFSLTTDRVGQMITNMLFYKVLLHKIFILYLISNIFIMYT